MTPKLRTVCNNCHFVETGETDVLFSYDTPVLEIKDYKIVRVFEAYSFSPTTSKHINKFIDSFGFIQLNGQNLFALDNRQRKKLLDEFYKNPKNTR